MSGPCHSVAEMIPTPAQTARLRQVVGLHRAGDFPTAEAGYRALIAETPDWVAPRSNLGSLLRTTGRPDAAEVELVVARCLAPSEIYPHRNLGNLYAEQERWPAAAEAYRAVLALDPADLDALIGLGEACAALDQFDDAETALAVAARQAPDDGRPWRLLAGLHGNLGRWREAEQAADRALALDPADLRTRTALGRFKLSQGDFAAGWPLYEARLGPPSQAASGGPVRWRGEDLAGRSILLVGEQGFGDQIQFVRFALVLRDMGADVTVLCVPLLLSLFDGLGVKVAPLMPGVPFPSADFWAPMMSVPLRLGIDERSIPAAPYLRAPDQARARWAGRVSADGVGVVWHGSRTNLLDRHRSLPSPDILAPVKADGANVYDLQKTDGDFADAAARIEQLSLVITVDTALAHLAGALGKPVWIMLPRHFVDFRWMEDRADSPWYPSMRVFRQRDLGDWGPVVSEMVAVLGDR